MEQGEVLGIIGKNGAGKSTLLKILSKVTGPTTGRIMAKGRIASLLEVGTGFHPELTGRENIYLNGTILGMSKAEVRKKLDEIVDFAGVERYLDTPVKRYSSGMKVRLGFAVAAHLEPDILIVDEVLAVGDAEFQKKAIGKMQEVSREGGRTVLFVSHNMGSIRELTSRSILLFEGKIRNNGETDFVINQYLSAINEQAIEDGQLNWPNGFNCENVLLMERIMLTRRDGSISTLFLNEESIHVRIIFNLLRLQSNLRFVMKLIDSEGQIVFASSSDELGKDIFSIGRNCVSVIIPPKLLNNKVYNIVITAGIPGSRVLFVQSEKLKFKVERSSERGSLRYNWPGIIDPVCLWLKNTD